jgi:hypothetical protein
MNYKILFKKVSDFKELIKHTDDFILNFYQLILKLLSSLVLFHNPKIKMSYNYLTAHSDIRRDWS